MNTMQTELSNVVVLDFRAKPAKKMPATPARVKKVEELAVAAKAAGFTLERNPSELDAKWIQWANNLRHATA